MLAAQAALRKEEAEGGRMQGLLLSRSATAAAFRQGSAVPKGVAAFTNTNRSACVHACLLSRAPGLWTAVAYGECLQGGGRRGVCVRMDACVPAQPCCVLKTAQKGAATDTDRCLLGSFDGSCVRRDAQRGSAIP